MSEGASYKRLILACDGTWQAGDKLQQKTSWFSWLNPFSGGPSAEELAKPILTTNVMKICAAIAPTATDNQGKKVQQVAFYQNGIGTDNNYLQGYTGAGLDDNVIEAYFYLAMNYAPGDEVFLFGFSRGAYTARCIADLIRCVGIFQKGSLDQFPIVWNAYKTKKSEEEWDAWVRQTEKKWERIRDIKIKVIGVWDTVGNLGGQYHFYNVELGDHVENAFQSLALDEHRKPYGPAVWILPPKKPGKPEPNLVQCWFPGVHTSVGGGSSNAAVQKDVRKVADLALVWMIDRCTPFLGFDVGFIDAIRETQASYKPASASDPSVGYGTGVVIDSYTGFMRLFGSKARTPGQYGDGGVTNEYMHPCVRVRKDVMGTLWNSQGLQNFNSSKQRSEDGLQSGWIWEKRVGNTTVKVNEFQISDSPPAFEKSLIDNQAMTILENK